jgi:hypothetical protein
MVISAFRALLAVTIILSAEASTATCEHSFKLAESSNKKNSTEKSIQFLRITDTSHLRIEVYRLGNLEVAVHRVEVIPVSMEELVRGKTNTNQAVPPLEAAEAKRIFTNIKDESVDLAIGQYRLRRGWKEPFFTELREAADSYLAWSTYISVRDKALPDSPLIGVLRFISAPYTFVKRKSDGVTWVGDYNVDPFQIINAKQDQPIIDSILPMEKILGIRLPRPARESSYSFRGRDGEVYSIGIGVLEEPGNLVVLKESEHSQTALAILGAESYLYFQRPTQAVSGVNSFDSIKQPTVFTYGNRASRMMYDSLGYQPFSAFSLDSDQLKYPGYQVLAISKNDALKTFINSVESRGVDLKLHRYLKEKIDDFRDNSVYPYFIWEPENGRSLPGPRLSDYISTGRPGESFQ